jgi:hypothetical protein
MPNEPALHAAMEGRGSYNKHAKLPAGSAALPLRERGLSEWNSTLTIRRSFSPTMVRHKGKTHSSPCKRAIRSLRRRLGPAYPVSVFHIDQPSNDFNTLFKVLGSDPGQYAFDDPSVFPGRSFYEQVLPPDSVHLGWCGNCAPARAWSSSFRH